MKSGIYRFINNRTGEVYVGQSHNVYARRGKHYKNLSMGTHHNRGMQEDYDNGDTFTFEILEEIPDATKEELDEREVYYIELFDSFYSGYNQTPGGEYDKYKGKYEYGGDRLPYSEYNPVPKPELIESCPKCGGRLVKKHGKHGDFASCSNYPKCDFSCSLKKVKLKPKNKPPSHYYTLPKGYFNQTSIKWTTCRYCGKKYNKVATVCPYCNDNKPSTPIVSNTKDKETNYNKTPSKPISNANEQFNYYKKPIKIEFEKFHAQKRNYLTRADCNYLAKKYNMDISNVQTTKKANPIVRNYLFRTLQWDSAMEDLYKHNNQLAKEYEIGATVSGHCPECGGVLKRVTKFFIQCENYPRCNFYCTDANYRKNILKLKPESEDNSSTQKQDSKPTIEFNSKENMPNESNTKVKIDKNSLGLNDEEKLELKKVNDKINKKSTVKNKTYDSTTKKDKNKNLFEEVGYYIVIFSTFICPILALSNILLLGIIGFVSAVLSIFYIIILLITEKNSTENDTAIAFIYIVWNFILLFLYYIGCINYLL